MTIKQERIQELMHTHLSDLLMTEVTDPALDSLNVTEVRIDREIEYADIYVHALGEEENQKEVMAGLKRANGFLRYNLAQRLRIRKMPVLRFHWDERVALGEHMEALLDQIKKELPPAPKEKEAE